MIFDCNRNKQLTKNFNVLDLKCKGSGHIHNTFVNIDFINKLQKFIDDNGFDKIEIIKGYLCNEYIKKNNINNDKYSKNDAIEICFYKNGEIVSADDVCKLANSSGIFAEKVDANIVYFENGKVAIPIKEKPKKEIIEEQTTFNEDTIDDLIEEGEVENVQD